MRDNKTGFDDYFEVDIVKYRREAIEQKIAVRLFEFRMLFFRFWYKEQILALNLQDFEVWSPIPCKIFN
jgi:hypothetical protein